MELSLIATLLAIVATFPQLYRTLQSGVLRDMHPTTLVIAIVANIVLALHGYRKKDMGIFVFGLWFVMYNSVLYYFLAA